MEQIECSVGWKGKNAKMVLREEDGSIVGYVGKSHVLTLDVDDDDELEETFCHDDLEYDEEEVFELVASALNAGEDDEEDEDSDEEDEDSDDEDSDDEDSDDEESDEEDDEESDEDDEDSDEETEVDEDEDADYGQAVRPANIAGVPTLHAVMVAYGSGIGVDGDVRLMRGLFERLQKEKLLNVSETLLTGVSATAAATLETIKLIEVGPDDVVWFFYSGHGCMEEGDRLLCTHGKMVRRESVVKAVKAKGARFAAVLSDCCAVEAGKLEPSEKLMGAGRGASREQLEKLFRRARGLFDVSSSEDYQYSFGGVFTPSLVEKTILGGATDSWREVFNRTQKLAMAQSDGALPADAKKKLRAEGKTVETHQKPVAFTLPDEG